MTTSNENSTALVEIRNRLLARPSVEVRADAAQHLGSLFSSGEMAEPERQIALVIFEKLARDVEQQVRQALALHVASCSFLPPTLARTIAEDVDVVAIPFVQVSPALSDDDLLAIIGSGSAEKQKAIATRETVSEPVAEALVATHDAGVVTVLLQNEGASVSEPSYHEIMDHFAADNMVQSLMVDRPWLPLGVTERLIQSVSDALRNRLVDKHALPADLAAELVGQAGERALVQDAKALPNAFDVEMLAARLNSTGKLTPTLLMRALCLGDMRFCEVGMAVLASIPPDNAATLMADRGPRGFKSLYERTGLPQELFRAFRTALDVHRELGAEGRKGWNASHIRVILDRVMRAYDEACPADLEQLLSQMSRQVLGRSERRGQS